MSNAQITTDRRTLRRKFETLRSHPIGVPAGILKSRLENLSCYPTLFRIYRNTKQTVKSSWPIYNFFDWYLNREARQAYRQAKAQSQLTDIERRIVNEVIEKGICIVHFEELFPGKSFKKIQDLTNSLVQKPANRQQIDAVERGAVSSDVTKYYLVKLAGRPPVFDYQDAFVELGLSDTMLRLAGAYYGMYSRMMDMDLWCNIPTDGPASYSQRWHKDADEKKMFKLLMYLCDVGPNTGPLCYIPETHTLGRFNSFYPHSTTNSVYPPEGSVDQRFSPEQIKVCTGKAGTMIFCDPTGLHRGGNPREGHRLLFHIAYTSNLGLVDPNNKNRYAIKGLEKASLCPAAKYAVGRL